MEVPQDQKEALERLFSKAYFSEGYQTFCSSYGLERSFLPSADFRTFLEENQEEVENILDELKLAE